MAISKGRESVDIEFKRYIGVTPVMVKAVNPTKEEHEKLFNTTLEESPKYNTVVEDNNGNSIDSARIQIIFQPDTDKIGFDMPLVTMALFIQNRPRVGATSGKTQVIDKYGRTAWVTPDELAGHKIPVYSNGPADIDKDYRPAYVGEEELTAFVKTFLRIPDVTVWDNNARKRVPNTKVKAEDCECRFDNLDKVFKGDFSEITGAISSMPTNKIKVLLGVRTDVETGRLYQTVYTKRFLSNTSTNYNSLDKEIQDIINNAVQNGRTVSTEYEAVNVHEYVVTPTTFTQSNEPAAVDNTTEMPFDTNSSSPWE